MKDIFVAKKSPEMVIKCPNLKVVSFESKRSIYQPTCYLQMVSDLKEDEKRICTSLVQTARIVLKFFLINSLPYLFRNSNNNLIHNELIIM